MLLKSEDVFKVLVFVSVVKLCLQQAESLVLWIPVINRCVKTEQSILKISIFLCSVGYVVELACYGEVDMHLGTKLMFSESSKAFGNEHGCKCLYL